MLNRNGHRVSGEVEENIFIALPGKRGPGSLVASTEWPALEGARVQGAGRVSLRALLTAGDGGSRGQRRQPYGSNWSDGDVLVGGRQLASPPGEGFRICKTLKGHGSEDSPLPLRRN